MDLFNELFASGEINSFGAFLAGSPSHVAFCCKPDVLDAVRTGLTSYGVPAGRIASLERFENYLALNLDVEQVIVVAPDNEDEAIASLHRSLANQGFPEPILATLNVVGLIADVLPYFIGGGFDLQAHERVWSGRPLATPAPATAAKRCFVFGSPRSGTTLLCSLMHAADWGDPREHLRPFVLELIERYNPSVRFDFVRFLRRLVEAGSVGGVFSTKSVGGFVSRLLKALTPEQISSAAEFMAWAPVVAVSRKGRLAQAISWVKAELTGRWHSYQSDSPPPAEIPLAMIREHLAILVAQDQALARLLASAANLVVVDYDELTQQPEQVMAAIAQSLEAPSPKPATASVEKIADDWNRKAAEAYLAAFPDEELLREPSLAQMLAEERRRLEEAARAMLARAERIRSGHAQSRRGAYQDRHYWLLDYETYSLEGLPNMLRGPRPASLEPGQYGVCIGAAQTYGAFVANPFPKMLGQRLGIDVLNLSGGGVGPRYFSESPRSMSLIANARFVVVQAMSARMMPTSMFAPTNEMNLMRMRDGSGENLDAETVWRLALERSNAEELRSLISQAHAAWVEAMLKIAGVCAGPKVLLWFSERPMNYDMQLDSVHKMFGIFPQLVDETCMRAVQSSFDATVEIVTNRGMPQTLVSHFSGEVLPVVFGGAERERQHISKENNYYPSPEMHEDAALALIACLSPRL